MYAHVTTHRLATSAEVSDEMEYSTRTGEPVNDQAARALASYWHSPSARTRNLTALSHGLPFDTFDLMGEVDREVGDYGDREALLVWVEHLEALLLGEAS